MQLTEKEERDIGKPRADVAAPASAWPPGGMIFAAALALPGLVGSAHAESAPDHGQIDVNYLDYRDRQPEFDRITVHSPSVRILAPIAGEWAVEGSAVSDSISGATPRYHSAVSGASTMSDRRNAEDAAVTRYFRRGSIKFGLARSSEHDYQSRAFSLQGTLSTEDKNTVGNAGIGVSNDTINPVNGVVSHARKHTLELTVGVTRIVTQNDIVQLNYTHAKEHGYLNDPYKDLDSRPDTRDENILLLRWNHHIDRTDGTPRFSYRYYTDSYGIRSHTLALEYVQPLSQGWALTPSVRAYTQTAANFYYGPVYSSDLGAPVPAGYTFAPGSHISEDYRLSAFGALTLGLKIDKQLTRDFRISLQMAEYEQRSGWAWSGGGGPGLAPLHARIINIGFSKQF